MKSLPKRRGTLMRHESGAIAVKLAYGVLHVDDSGWFWMSDEEFIWGHGLAGWDKVPATDLDEGFEGYWHTGGSGS